MDDGARHQRARAGAAAPGRWSSWPEGERLKREKEILGFFISGHPLDKYREEIALFDRVNTANLKEHRDQKVELACVVTDVARQISKRDGSEWGRITVEDFFGTATVLAFGETWQQNKELLQKDAPVLVCGGVSGRERDEEDPPIFLDGVVAPRHRCARAATVGLCIELAPPRATRSDPPGAQGRSPPHPGPAPLMVLWRNGGRGGRRRACAPARCASRRARSCVAALREVLGEESVRLVKA